MKILCRLLILWVLIVVSTGQGLQTRKGELQASTAKAKQLADQYQRHLETAQGIAKNFKAQSTGKKKQCVGGNFKLCASALLPGGNADDDSALLALGPLDWNWARPPGASDGDLLSTSNPFGPVRDQGKCGTCLSFAVVGAAEAAVARTMGLRGGAVRISVRDHGFCPTKEGAERYCSAGMQMEEGLKKLKDQVLLKEDCLPYDTSKLYREEDVCSASCRSFDSNADKGRFNYDEITSFPAIQRHIRRFGGVVSKMNLDEEDLRRFFASNPTGVYDGKGCDAVGEDGTGHAVVIVGYNNKEGYWVVRNSWGQGFADGGYFKIKYGKCGVGGSGTFGVSWTPNSGVKIPFGVSQDAQKPGCYLYKPRQGDSISGIADALGVDAFQLLYDNTEEIEDIDGPLAGKTLRVCGITNNKVDLKMPGWVGRSGR